VKVIVPPENVPKGWDAGDLVKAGADRAAVQAFIKERATFRDTATREYSLRDQATKAVARKVRVEPSRGIYLHR
jgi:hypothetical protein